MKKLILLRNLMILLCFLTVGSNAWAKVRLPNIIGSHMVLQQKSKVKLWGWAAASETITIKTTWDTTTYKAVANNGAHWEAEINTPAAGGSYTITIEGENKIVLEDVLIGEVWVCSGQSNMEWSGDQDLKESINEAPHANQPEIRLFYVSKSTSLYPQDNLEGKWVVCSPESMIHFSAIGYFFGKKINSSIKTPVGLINANWGGTPAETWTPAYVIEKDPIIKKGAESLGQYAWWPSNTAIAYNAMIAPLTKFSISGVLWYQGESNVSSYYSYEQLFTGMIDAWRAAWNKNFPFYFVQIAPYTYGNNINGALLRETQTKASRHPNTAMVVVSDLVPDTTNIHPTLKIEVANRLANIALKNIYNQNMGVVNGPLYESLQVEKEKAILSFSNIGAGLMCKDKELNHFEIAGADHLFVPGTAKIIGDKIIVTNKNIKAPVAVRYAFNNTAIGNVFNKEGLPLNLFRTDNW